jgi:hypothetical protein
MSSVHSSSEVLALFNLGFASPAGSAGLLRSSPASPVLGGKLDWGRSSSSIVRRASPSWGLLEACWSYVRNQGKVDAQVLLRFNWWWHQDVCQRWQLLRNHGPPNEEVCIRFLDFGGRLDHFDLLRTPKGQKGRNFSQSGSVISPLLLASSFDGDLSSLLAQTDSVDHWVEWFTVLNSKTVQSAPPEMKIDLAKRAFKLEPTPAKRNRSTKLPFSPVDDDFEKITPMLI